MITLGKPFALGELEARIRDVLRRENIRMEKCLDVLGELQFDTMAPDIKFLLARSG